MISPHKEMTDPVCNLMIALFKILYICLFEGTVADRAKLLELQKQPFKSHLIDGFNFEMEILQDPECMGGMIQEYA